MRTFMISVEGLVERTMFVQAESLAIAEADAINEFCSLVGTDKGIVLDVEEQDNE